MEYRNTKTGIILKTSSSISGKNWEPVEKPAPEPEKPVTEPETKAVTKNGRNRKKQLRNN